jgi:DNA primase
LHIPREIIDQIRDRAQIQDIVQKYVPGLKKKGKNYSGLCPFHKESLPSFTVSSDKQIFYCFGCHAGGNVFSFISKIERLTYIESIKFLAGITGVDISRDPVYEAKEKEIKKQTDINEYAVSFYQKTLNSPSGSPAAAYLKKRGISDAVIKEFRIGFSPDSWSSLLDSLNAAGYDAALAEKTGLLAVSEKSGQHRYYDRFRNRVVFPISDVQGRAIGFGGRVMDDSLPKYLNTPESDVFRKREILYGIDLAKDSIRDLNRAIIVEGYLDVIGCRQHGIQNAVAPLGTALTPSQLKFLSRYCSEAVLLFDADSAGLKAAVRSIELVHEVNLSLKIALLPEDDPFDFVMKRGPRELLALIDKAVEPVQFMIDQTVRRYGSESRMNTIIALFEILKNVSFDTERDRHISNISRTLNIDETSFKNDYYNYYLKNQKPSEAKKTDNSVIGSDYTSRCFVDMVRIVSLYPGIIDKVIIELSSEVDEIQDPLMLKIVKKIIEINTEGSDFSIDKLFDFLEADSEMEFLNKIVNTGVDIEIDNPVAAFTESYLSLRRYKIDRLLKRYHEYLRDNRSGLNDYLLEIDSLTREKDKLVNYIYNKTIGI